ncbi:MAG: hypothetical protein ACHQVS_01925 [Candidatus Babeliales bacterium]
MNKLYAVLFSLMISVSGCAWGADLMLQQQELEECVKTALCIKVVLTQKIPTTLLIKGEKVTFKKEELEKDLKEHLAHIDDLMNQEVILPDNITQELREFGEKFEQFYKKLNAQ